MERSEIFKKLDEIFNDVLDPDDEITLNENSCADDIDEWDSLSHIQLVVAIEKEYKIKFTSKEIMSWQKVGDMVDSIIAKIG